MMSDFLATLPSLQAYLLVAAMLFCIGVWGLINSRNAVRVLMSIELMLNACLLYTSPSPRDGLLSRMPSSA